MQTYMQNNFPLCQKKYNLWGSAVDSIIAFYLMREIINFYTQRASYALELYFWLCVLTSDYVCTSQILWVVNNSIIHISCIEQNALLAPPPHLFIRAKVKRLCSYECFFSHSCYVFSANIEYVNKINSFCLFHHALPLLCE